MKIIFTSVGRRVELMQAFRRAADVLSMELEIYGADMDETAPALQFCDHFIKVPAIRDEAYIPFLLDVCSKEKMDALIPTIDTDLMILSENKERFEEIGTKAFISAPEKIAVCRDKRFTAEYFHSVGLYSPDPVDNVDEYNGGFPAFIKPKDGSSSIFAYKASDQKELRELAGRVPDYVIQPFVKGTEYTIDIFCDYDGKPVYITPRIRLAVRAGEVLKTRIDLKEDMVEDMMKLTADYRPCGAITVQLIREDDTGKNMYIEINPRFGGGSPISMLAGADSASALLRILGGEQLSFMPDAALNGSTYSRFDQTVRVD